ncbi:enoyl-CoA hydratase/isomerase family protein [Psychroflexus planctonicus]|uniref:Enoyl-CoA hydratase n=1 Tax=Psychroflexus planctonicus TaxID=1526575 RepID=A0ABQ1SEV0_9FLAO|nr:enoyl-CoA hydratase-related protein [Psychroflexus planctonicus]GGE26256.1 enoyl-CoA hydratase [Psychroflexus planctonicus]
MNFENIILQVEEKVAKLVINRPKKLNALNRATLEEIHNALQACKINEDVKVVVITGAGEKAFVAGADIAEFANYSVGEGKDLAAKGQELVFDFIANFPKPVIAAVNGFALGGGLELAMAAHFRVASTNAKLGLPETSLGVIPGYGGTQRLPQLVGKGRAMEMIMTAKMISAEEAINYGLVNHVCELEELEGKVNGIVQKILNNSLQAIESAIKAVNDAYVDGVNGFESEIDAFGKAFGTSDFKEGTTAFLNKQKPDFK